MPSYIEMDQIPGDKSISHRAIILGSMAQGISRFKGFLCSHDCLNTLAIYRQLGVKIDQDGTTVTVHGRGVDQLKNPDEDCNVGNSGTAIRLIAGMVSGTHLSVTLTGDESIQKRPMGRIIDPLQAMGAQISASNQQPPLHIQGTANLVSGFHYKMPIASAQVKSALLLAGVAANKPVKVTEPEECRDHTERMLGLYGADIKTKNGTISLQNSQLIAPHDPIQIPADISSALFFICYALMTKKSVVFKHIGLNKSRIGCLQVLKMMGAEVHVSQQDDGYEPIGDITIKPSNNRKNITVPLDIVPNVIDELPILAALALTQDGEFRVHGAAELRVKESDRIAGICRLITAIGGFVEEYDDGFCIFGPLKNPQSFAFDSHFDHRLAMSAKILATTFDQSADITGTESIPTSFPNFDEILTNFIRI